MIRRQIAALTHGSFLIEAPSKPRGLLVGFHGYGEKAENHFEQLQRIPEAHKWLVCSVQSLHLFYKSRSQEVIGSWMTRQDREPMIEHNIGYVRSVISRLQREFEITAPLVFAGFSQGVAMAYRAAACSGVPCSGLLALAGDVPPEIAQNRLLPLPPVLLGRGLADPWYTKEKMEIDLASLRGRTEVTECIFEGAHEWSVEFVDQCDLFLRKIWQLHSEPDRETVA